MISIPAIKLFSGFALILVGQSDVDMCESDILGVQDRKITDVIDVPAELGIQINLASIWLSDNRPSANSDYQISENSPPYRLTCRVEAWLSDLDAVCLVVGRLQGGKGTARAELERFVDPVHQDIVRYTADLVSGADVDQSTTFVCSLVLNCRRRGISDPWTNVELTLRRDHQITTQRPIIIVPMPDTISIRIVFNQKSLPDDDNEPRYVRVTYELLQALDDANPKTSCAYSRPSNSESVAMCRFVYGMKYSMLSHGGAYPFQEQSNAFYTVFPVDGSEICVGRSGYGSCSIHLPMMSGTPDAVIWDCVFNRVGDHTRYLQKIIDETYHSLHFDRSEIIVNIKENRPYAFTIMNIVLDQAFPNAAIYVGWAIIIWKWNVNPDHEGGYWPLSLKMNEFTCIWIDSATSVQQPGRPIREYSTEELEVTDGPHYLTPGDDFDTKIIYLFNIISQNTDDLARLPRIFSDSAKLYMYTVIEQLDGIDAITSHLTSLIDSGHFTVFADISTEVLDDFSVPVQRNKPKTDRFIATTTDFFLISKRTNEVTGEMTQTIRPGTFSAIWEVKCSSAIPGTTPEQKADWLMTHGIFCIHPDS